MILDLDNRILDVNKKTLEITGAAADDFVGRYCYEVFHGKSCPPEQCPYKPMLMSNTPQSCPVVAEKLNMTLQVTVSPIYDADGNTDTVLHIAHDITQKVKQDALKLELSLQREQLIKLESLKTMAGAIAHRCNNSMMVVQGNLTIMMSTLGVDSDEYEMASNAISAARGISEIGRLMLSYVGLTPPKLQKISLFNLVKKSVVMQKALLQPSISLHVEQTSQSFQCFMDSLQIQEVIQSVLSNAIESLEDGKGEIKITFGRDHFFAESFTPPFQDGRLKDGIYTFCQIQDTGHGINPENMLQLFEPFYSTKFIGRGLGLALTVAVMQSHCGAITIESSPGQGTIVRILFPSVPTSHQVVPPSDGD